MWTPTPRNLRRGSTAVRVALADRLERNHPSNEETEPAQEWHVSIGRRRGRGKIEALDNRDPKRRWSRHAHGEVERRGRQCWQSIITCPIAPGRLPPRSAPMSRDPRNPSLAETQEPTSYRRGRPGAPTVGDSPPPPGRQENAETQRQVRSRFANVTPSDVTISRGNAAELRRISLRRAAFRPAGVRRHH